jgi:hypothetical protein
MKITKEQLKQIIKEETMTLYKEGLFDIFKKSEKPEDIQRARDLAYVTQMQSKLGVSPDVSVKHDPEYSKHFVDPKHIQEVEETREPWDGIEANARMISDNAIKIEYLARQLQIEIPVEPKL